MPPSVRLRRPRDLAARARRRAMLGICIGFALLLLDANVLNVAAPALRDALGASPEALLWIIDGYALASAGLLLAAGTFGDIFGARRVFLAGLSTFVLASLACAASQSAAMLIAARVVQGVGAALVAPMTLALLRELHPDAAERAQALAIWASISGLAFALGPLVGGALVTSAGWPSIFAINLPLGLLGIVLVLGGTPGGPAASPKTPRPFDPLSQALGIAALSALTFTLIQAQKGPAVIAVPLLAGGLATLVALGGFVLRERGKPDAVRVVPLAVLRARVLRTGLCAGAAFNFCLYGALLALTLHLQDARHFSPLETGAIFLPLTALHAIVAMAITGRVTAARGPHLPLAVGLALGAAATATIALAALLGGGAGDPPLAIVLAALGVFGIGSGLTTAPLTELVIGHLPDASLGVGSATLNASRQIGGLLGIALLGAITIGEPRGTPLGLALALAALVMAAAAVGVARVRGGAGHRFSRRASSPVRSTGEGDHAKHGGGGTGA